MPVQNFDANQIEQSEEFQAFAKRMSDIPDKMRKLFEEPKEVYVIYRVERFEADMLIPRVNHVAAFIDPERATTVFDTLQRNAVGIANLEYQSWVIRLDPSDDEIEGI